MQAHICYVCMVYAVRVKCVFPTVRLLAYIYIKLFSFCLLLSVCVYCALFTTYSYLDVSYHCTHLMNTHTHIFWLTLIQNFHRCRSTSVASYHPVFSTVSSLWYGDASSTKTFPFLFVSIRLFVYKIS